MTTEQAQLDQLLAGLGLDDLMKEAATTISAVPTAAEMAAVQALFGGLLQGDLSNLMEMVPPTMDTPTLVSMLNQQLQELMGVLNALEQTPLGQTHGEVLNSMTLNLSKIRSEAEALEQWVAVAPLSTPTAPAPPPQKKTLDSE